MFYSGIIASIQPRWNSVFNNNELIASFAVECAPHVVALRIEGYGNVESVSEALGRKGLRTPIIGIIKEKENVLNTLITPSHEQAERLMDFGADYVAMEISDRIGVNSVVESVKSGVPVIADIGHAKHIDIALGCGVCAITTALSGYLNARTHPFAEPDIDLLKACVESGVPIVAEGRYRTPKHLEMAREAGAHAVCMGNAIHEPKQTALFSRIIFDGSWKELSKNDFAELF